MLNLQAAEHIYRLTNDASAAQAESDLYSNIVRRDRQTGTLVVHRINTSLEYQVIQPSFGILTINLNKPIIDSIASPKFAQFILRTALDVLKLSRIRFFANHDEPINNNTIDLLIDLFECYRPNDTIANIIIDLGESYHFPKDQQFMTCIMTRLKALHLSITCSSDRLPIFDPQPPSIYNNYSRLGVRVFSENYETQYTPELTKQWLELITQRPMGDRIDTFHITQPDAKRRTWVATEQYHPYSI